MAESRDFNQPTKPNGHRRAPWHDYRRKWIYLITINKAPGISDFSTLAGSPDSHDNPPHSKPTPLGKIIKDCIYGLPKDYPFVSILRSVIMPDHVHFVIYVKESTDIHLGLIINKFKTNCSIISHDAGLGAAIDMTLFEEGYHDRILKNNGQLARMLKYVSDNPRRRMERMLHPDFFHRTDIAGPNGELLEAYGNKQLLEDCEIEAVKISRSYSADELKRKKQIWLHTVYNGGVLVSPFISQAEKKVLDWACANRGRIILITNNGFGNNYTPKGRLHELCEEGRLLVIAPAEHSTAAVTLTREACLRMNAIAEAIASYMIKLR